MTAQTILPANTLSSGDFVTNSARFESAQLLRTNTSATATNIDKYTVSVWVKRSKLGVDSNIIADVDGSGAYYQIYFKSDDTLRWQEALDGTNDGDYITTRKFRDVGAWYHIVCRYDSSLGTAGDRMRIYINGVEETSFSTEDAPDQNDNGHLGESNSAKCIADNDADGREFFGYMCEFMGVDGQSLAPTSFGEFDSDSGIWTPIDISGITQGVHGFYLQFQDSSDLGTATLGADWAPTALAATDQSTDTCQNNFATMNPLAYRLDSGVSLPTYSEGNTVVSYANDSGAGKSTMATIGFQNGKWYWEYKVGTANDTIFGGITRMDYDPNDNFAGRSCFYNKSGAFSVGTGTGGTSDGSYGDSYTTDDIIGVAFDCDNGVIWFSKNGTWQNSATQSEIEAGTTTNSATTGITLNQFWSPFLEGAESGMSINFGSPAYAISSGNTDGNGYGNFEYAVPSGYFALNTKNLAEYG